MSNTLFDDTSDSNTENAFVTNAPAESFNSGTGSAVLTDIKVALEDFEPSDGGSVEIELLSNSGSSPGSEVASLGTIADSSLSSSMSLVDVPISGGPTLTANTEYWIELVSVNNSYARAGIASSPSGTGVSGQTFNYGGTNYSQYALTMDITADTCFAAGTRILTARGEVAVEDLKVDDLAMALLGGRLSRVRWIGHRHVDLRAHPKPQNINPVRVRAHAFGEGLPQRDLILSPNHALYAEGVLIPVRYLLNGATVVQEEWDSATYYHVELDTHDVLLAEGLPAESYLDAGNRAAFANGGGPMVLHPDFGAELCAVQPCARRVGWGPEVAKLRQALLDQAASLGHTRTSDANVRVLAGGRVIAPRVSDGDLQFDLPAGTGTVRLLSRSFSTNDTRTEDYDGRRLGVGVTFVALDGLELADDAPALSAGWHDPEPALRWTNGDATLHTGGARRLTLRLHPGVTYWAEREEAQATAQRA